MSLPSFITPAFMETIGGIAALLTTSCWLPQAIKTVRTRDTRGISLIMQVMLTFGILLWLFYGIYLGNWPLIISNIITFLFVTIVLVMKLRYG